MISWFRFHQLMHCMYVVNFEAFSHVRLTGSKCFVKTLIRYSIEITLLETTKNTASFLFVGGHLLQSSMDHMQLNRAEHKLDDY